MIYSYTVLNAYKNCPHAMYRRYIKKDIPFVESEPMRYGSYLHAAFEQRLGYGKALPDDLAQHEELLKVFADRRPRVEAKLAMTRDRKATGYYGDDCFLRGKLDLYMLKDDRAYIIDWKTGSSNYADSFELAIQALLLMTAQPNLRHIQGHYCYLRENKNSPVYAFDWSTLVATADQVEHLVHGIENELKIDDFEKKQSGLCGHCDVTDCEFNRAHTRRTREGQGLSLAR